MARTRYIKPGIMLNEDLADLGPYAYVLFTSLWMLADKEGRLEDRPRRIKAQAMPYWDVTAEQVHLLLEALDQGDFIHRYQIKGSGYIQVTNWKRHQRPHVREGRSTYPAPPPREPQVPPDQGDSNAWQVSTDLGSAEAVPEHNLGDASAQPFHHLGLSKVSGEWGTITNTDLLSSSVFQERGVQRGECLPCACQEEAATTTTASLEEEAPEHTQGAAPQGLHRHAMSSIQQILPQVAAVLGEEAPRKPQAQAPRMAIAEARKPQEAKSAPEPYSSTPSKAGSEAVLSSLLELAREARMSRPDMGIVQRLLQIQPDPDRLHEALVYLHKAGRLRNMTTWGYVPVVIERFFAA